MMRYGLMMLAVSACVLGVLAPAEATFVRVDDFEGYAAGAIDNATDGSGVWSAHSSFAVGADPADAGNQTLILSTDAGTSDAYIDDAKLLLPDGDTGTLFLRFRRPAASNHVNFGLSDLATPGGDFAHFEAQLRSEGDDLDVRDGGSFDQLNPAISADQWMNVWVVTDNGADTTSVYIQSNTQFPAQTLLNNGPQTSFAFRNGTADALQTFFMRNSGGHAGPWYLDDLYFDPAGANLVNPVPTGVVVNDPFSDGVADGFEVIDGNTSGADGAFVVQDDGDGNFVYSQTVSGMGTGPGNLLGGYSLAEPVMGDLRLDLDLRLDDVTLDPGNAAADAAIVFGWQDEQNYYYALFNKTAGFNEVFKVEAGVRSTIGTPFAPQGIADGLFHGITLTRSIDSGLIELSIDGVDVFSAIDTTFGAGRVGVGALNDAASFDNFTLSGRQVPEPASAMLVVMATAVGMRRRSRAC